MKELSIEEKAKRYDGAIKRARKIENREPIDVPDGSSIPVAIFPELAESEDEKIRKEMLQIAKESKDSFYMVLTPNKRETLIAWLEKQGESDETKAKVFLMNKGYPIDTNGVFPTYEEMYNIIREGLEQQSEQNHVNGVEPKFNVGDWVVNKFGDSWHIDSFDKKNYQVSDGKGNYNYFSISNQDEMRLWTIQDAKNWDVLVSNDASYIVLFKGLSYLEDNIDRFKSYCHYSKGIFSHIEDSSWCCNAFHPATKEQRKTLFAKMKEWDADKKKEPIKL